MAPSLTWFLIVVVGFLGGCLGASESTSSDAASSTPVPSVTGTPTFTTTSSTSTSDSLPSDPEPRTVAFSGCYSVGTSLPVPASVAPGSAPPGWANEKQTALVMMQMFRCERISWGHFERGPIHLIFESHSNMSPPPACTEGEFGQMHVLHALWVDDSEVATWVNDTYGLPVRDSGIRAERTLTADSVAHHWEWAMNGTEASVLDYEERIVEPDNLTLTTRYAWAAEETVWLFDLTQSGKVTATPGAAATGTMRPPTLMAEAGFSTYAGLGAGDLGTHLFAHLLKFGDLQCQDPA